MTLVKCGTRTARRPCKYCGKSKDLYWGHDTTRQGSNRCQKCGSIAAWVLLHRDGSLHSCRDTTPKEDAPVATRDTRLGPTGRLLDGLPDADPPKGRVITAFEMNDDPFGDPFESKKVAVTKEEAATAKEVARITDKRSSAKAAAPATDPRLAALETLFGAPKIDEDKIREIVADIVDGTLFPTRTVVLMPDGALKKEIEGATHHMLADVITSLLAGEHVLMVGPAGTGKSTIAEQAATALGLKAYSISLSPQTPASQLLGYMQAAGEYVRSLFREAYENGGVFHFDEMDNAHPSVLATINAALANGHMAFPDQMVKRHADFRAVASANTYGKGATREYVGRQAIDAATLDRFTIEDIPIDEALENDLCRSIGLEPAQVERVLVFVRAVRRNVEAKKLPIVISPRASFGMVKLLKAGKSWEAAVVSRVRRGLDDTTWNKILP